MGRVYHVAKNGNDSYPGNREYPFLTISKAASVAEKGDRVIVHEGEYREWVSPVHSGVSNQERIIYEAAPGEKAVIKGSERIQGWVREEGNVWKVTLPNTFFENYNPYCEEIGGDWFVYPTEFRVHTGEVYLNGKSFFEARCLEDVKNPQRREYAPGVTGSGRMEKVLYPENTVYQWYAEVDADNTVIYANFQGADPNEELTEINVRKYCFYPKKTGRDYITVRGFEMAQAATPWTPPTADQPGLIGAHWSKGWIIENNIIHDSKCSGISIGKEASTGHNLSTRKMEKSGYQYQMEAVFRGLLNGWCREKIGSHIVRNNEIYNCGQNGIVGHMGGAFSQIYGNHIYNIGVKREFFGWEIAGIKLHAGIDVRITHNRIHDCTLGTWLDWQAQGIRIHGNLYYRNDRDLMVEVTHGPLLVDNNIFASAQNFHNAAQGTAFVHNLCCGSMFLAKVMDRATPYHFPHSTKVAGVAIVTGGDDRYYNNVFVGGAPITNTKYGTVGYNGRPASFVEYQQNLYQDEREDHFKFQGVEQPVYIRDNVYYNNAEAYEKETGKIVLNIDPQVKIEETTDGVYLSMYVDRDIFDQDTVIHGTDTLGSVRIVQTLYEAADGAPVIINTDYLGNAREESPLAGPFEKLQPGENKVKVW